jgi:hypothetical protein
MGTRLNFIIFSIFLASSGATGGQRLKESDCLLAAKKTDLFASYSHEMTSKTDVEANNLRGLNTSIDEIFNTVLGSKEDAEIHETTLSHRGHNQKLMELILRVGEATHAKDLEKLVKLLDDVKTVGNGIEEHIVAATLPRGGPQPHLKDSSPVILPDGLGIQYTSTLEKTRFSGTYEITVLIRASEATLKICSGIPNISTCEAKHVKPAMQMTQEFQSVRKLKGVDEKLTVNEKLVPQQTFLDYVESRPNWKQAVAAEASDVFSNCINRSDPDLKSNLGVTYVGFEGVDNSKGPKPQNANLPVKR